MKWYNTDKTKCLDLTSVSYWEFSSKETQTKEYSKKHPAFNDFLKPESLLKVVTSGHAVDFYGKEAEEIYHILKKQKELL
jgi:hypothetical protein